jgi:hypothetical protein
MGRMRPGIDWVDIEIPPSVKPWTDDFVDVLGSFKSQSE